MVFFLLLFAWSLLRVCACARVWVFLATLCVIMPACISLLHRYAVLVCTVYYVYMFDLTVLLLQFLVRAISLSLFRFTKRCANSLPIFIRTFLILFSNLFLMSTRRRRKEKDVRIKLNTFGFLCFFVSSFSSARRVCLCLVSKSNLIRSILKVCSVLLTIKCAKSIVSIFPIPPIHRSSKIPLFSSSPFCALFCSHLSNVNSILCMTFWAIDTLAIRFSWTISTIAMDCERTVRSFQSVRLMNQKFVSCSYCDLCDGKKPTNGIMVNLKLFARKTISEIANSVCSRKTQLIRENWRKKCQGIRLKDTWQKCSNEL